MSTEAVSDIGHDVLTVAVYGPLDSGLEAALERFGNWNVLRLDMPEPVPVSPDVVVCSVLADLPMIRKVYPEPMPLVYVDIDGLPYENHPAKAHTRGVLTEDFAQTPYVASFIYKVIEQYRERIGYPLPALPGKKPWEPPSREQCLTVAQRTVPPALDRLAPYQGGEVTVDAYSHTHRRLRLQLTSPDKHMQTYIVCTACLHFHGSFHWQSAQLTIEGSAVKLGRYYSQYIIKDEQSDFALSCLLFEFTDRRDF